MHEHGSSSPFADNLGPADSLLPAAGSIFSPPEAAPAPLLNSIPRNRVSDSNEGIILEGYDPPRPEFQVCPITISEAIFRHSGWRHQRQRVWESLLRIHANNARLDRFANCGASCSVEYSPSTQEVRYVGSCCHDRTCLPCGIARSGKIARALVAALPPGCVRFITLTLRHNDNALRDQLDRLYACFLALRRRKFWLAGVTGGAAFLEVKLGEKDGRWHPHLHILVSGKWLDQKALSKEWLAVTGDSSIVDVRSVPDRAEVSGYVAKYAAKPLDGKVIDCPPKLDEAIISLRGRRLCFTFGDWRGIDLDADAPDPGDWQRLGSLSALLSDTRSGDPAALQILDCLLNRRKLPLKFFDGPGPPPNTSGELPVHSLPDVNPHPKEQS